MRQRWKRAALCLLLATSLTGWSGCGGSGEGGPDPSCLEGDPRAQVVASIGQSLIVPSQEAFAEKAAALESALRTAAAAPEDVSAKEAAQSAWREAMTQWQAVELMLVGPALPSDKMGGQNLRSQIYSWPNTSLCLVDQQTVQDGHDDPNALAEIAGGPRGLSVIEYLLFTDGTEHHCTPLHSINEVWETMLDELSERRLAYAAALAELARQSADELVEAWSPEGGNFIRELSDPCRRDSVYGTAQEALNEISNGMFYLDGETKDMKLGEPAGLSLNDPDVCPEIGTCPALLESPWAEHSKQNVVANLEAFQTLFLGAAPGTDEPGFDDLLASVNAADVSTSMSSAIADAIVAAEAIPGTLKDALESDFAAVQAAYDKTKSVTDLLKNEFLSALDLSMPDRAAGDDD